MSIRKLCFLSMLIIALSTFSVWGQKNPILYHNGVYQVYSIKDLGFNFKVFDISVLKNQTKVVFFGGEAKQKFNHWKKTYKKRILCYFEIGFTANFDSPYAPVGMSIENGSIRNRNIDPSMDGLVSVTPYGFLEALDIEKQKAYGRYDLRKSWDRMKYFSVASSRKVSSIQTQLMYSRIDGKKMGDLKYGAKSSRRFFAICRDKTQNPRHLILESSRSSHLNHAAESALHVLKSKGLTVDYLLNLDTGAKNIMASYNEKGKVNYSAPMDISKADQLIVYYLD